MTLAVLFGKLQEHDLELGCLEEREDLDKKINTISLKERVENCDGSHCDDSQNELDNENLTFLVKKFGKFLRRNNSKKSTQFSTFVKRTEVPS